MYTTSMNKVVLVTGASSGIGKDAVLRLLKEGHIVYGASLPAEIQNTDDIINAGGRVLKLDVTNHRLVKKAVAQVIAEQGRIDVLFNNAGYGIFAAMEDVAITDARDQFAVNVFGLADMIKEVLPQMRKQRSGTIINASSIAGKIYAPLGSWYYASKHAIEGLSDCLRTELIQFGINVVILEPASIETSFIKRLYSSLHEKSRGGPYQRMVDGHLSKKRAYSNLKGSPSSVVSDIVVNIVRAKRPKTRYVVGKFGRPLLFMRKWVSDRLFDKLILRLMGCQQQLRQFVRVASRKPAYAEGAKNSLAISVPTLHLPQDPKKIERLRR